MMVHPVFHIRLLQKWNVAGLQEEEDIPTEELEVEEPYYEIEKLLRCKKVKRGLTNQKGMFSIMERLSDIRSTMDPCREFCEACRFTEICPRRQPLRREGVAMRT